MTVQEKRTFIEDPRPNMTTEEKNRHLAHMLGLAPHHAQNIFCIERVEIGASGWWIDYRTESPD
jgi:hypothetical protein